MTTDLKQVSGRASAADDIGPISDGMQAARAFKFYAQFNRRAIAFPLKYERLNAIGVYRSGKSIFDSLVKVFDKHLLDVGKYIKYVVKKNNLLDDDYWRLLDMKLIRQYAEDISTSTQRKHVYKLLVKSANFVAKYCVDNQLLTAVDGIKDMIHKKKLAVYYATGKVSKYYLALIRNFPAIVEKLDTISKDELSSVVNHYEKLNDDALSAMAYVKGFVFKIINLTDEMIDHRYGKMTKKKS